MAQHDKKFCLSHFISQIPCIIWLSFMVYMCNNDISWKNPVLRNNSIHISGTIIHHTIFIISKFHFFLFWFSGLLGGKMAKTAQNDKKMSLTLYLRNRTSYECGFWHACVKWYIQHFLFFMFSNFWFLGLLGLLLYRFLCLNILSFLFG